MNLRNIMKTCHLFLNPYKDVERGASSIQRNVTFMIFSESRMKFEEAYSFMFSL